MTYPSFRPAELAATCRAGAPDWPAQQPRAGLTRGAKFNFGRSKMSSGAQLELAATRALALV